MDGLFPVIKMKGLLFLVIAWNAVVINGEESLTDFSLPSWLEKLIVGSLNSPLGNLLTDGIECWRTQNVDAIENQMANRPYKLYPDGKVCSSVVTQANNCGPVASLLYLFRNSRQRNLLDCHCQAYLIARHVDTFNLKFYIFQSKKWWHEHTRTAKLMIWLS